MNKYTKYFYIIAGFFTPLFSFASGLVECKENCGFNELMALVNKVISFLLFDFATPLAAIAFCYAGWLYISSGGDTESVGKAKTIMKNVVLGYVVALCAWLIVKTILTSLGFTDSTFLAN